ncbi:LytTR family transcriptional regulator DNA-binding domain-containing protein [Bacteroides sp.]
MDMIRFDEDKFLLSHKKSCVSYLYKDLIAIEYEKPYIVLRVDSNKLVFQLSLCTILEKLPSYFLLVNRNTIINMQHTVGIIIREKRYYIQMDNEELYKISVRKVVEVKESFMRKEQK